MTRINASPFIAKQERYRFMLAIQFNQNKRILKLKMERNVTPRHSLTWQQRIKVSEYLFY